MTQSTTAATPRRIHVSFSDEKVQGMINLVKACPLPNHPPVNASQKWELGMDLGYLKELRDKFVNEWSWKDLERKLNEFENYVVALKKFEFDMHFVHARSSRADAVPIVLLHGWPGTIFDFHKVIKKLVDPPEGQRAFHVVVPSLPGFFLSTLPKREDWQLDDAALAVNHLMVDVLGYDRYAMQGGDFGSFILRVASSLFPEHAPFTLFNMLKVIATPKDNFEPTSFAVKKNMEQRKRVAESGMGYFTIQRTKPFTIGYAIGSSPLAILAYIGEKFQAWTDPRCLDTMDIIDTTALYFLSGSFATSVMTYQQGSALYQGLKEDREKWAAKSKIGFSVFPYEIGNSPVEDLQIMGEVAFYSEHEKGGHFPALEVPDELVDDIRRCFVGF